MLGAVRHRPDIQDWADLEPNEFCYRRGQDGTIRWMSFWPSDCPHPMSVAIRPQKLGNGAYWTLSGSEDRPTLHPSVDTPGWHGWVRDGEAVLA